MDSDDFGPMTSADETAGDSSAALRQQVAELQKQKEQAEAEFGQKRAKFMELYLQKEEEVKVSGSEVEKIRKENEELKTQIANLKTELDDIKTAAAISEVGKEDLIDEAKRKCQEEVASLQHIMKEAVVAAQHEASNQLESERHIREAMEAELQELRAKLSIDREGFLSTVAKSLHKKVAGGSLSPGNLSQTEAENLEESMKKAQEDAEMLKSVVMPLEEEIVLLKSKLRTYAGRCDNYEKKYGLLEDDQDKTSTSSLPAELDEKVKELNHHLETEKSSRTDLEMYVAVLNTQKNVLQEDADKLRTQMEELCKILELEKREHTDLKRTWQMANDQFLESQRLMMMDMRRMEGVLTAEQQRQIGELKKKDAEREAQEQRVRELEQQRIAEQKKQEANRAGSQEVADTSEAQMDTSKASLTSLVSEDLLKFDDDASISQDLGITRSQSGSALSAAAAEADTMDGGATDTQSLNEVDGSLRLSPEKNIHVPALTEAQQRAITDPTPESEASQSLLATAKARMETFPSVVGRRIVSEKEWQGLQEELKASREKLGRPCDMCANYEAQLQGVQDDAKKAQAQVRTLERQLQAERQAITNQTQYQEELEKTLQTSAIEAQKEISTLVNKVQESEKYVLAMKAQFSQIQTELQSQLKMLSEGREEIQKELTQLQEENDCLIGKHSQHSQQLQEESIDLPNTVEELHLLLLKCREDLIQAKVAKEHVEDTLKSEIMFLKDQVVAEQEEKNKVEEALSGEISNLQENLAMLQSAKSEMDRQSSLRGEAENKLKETENSLKNIQAKSKQLINALQTELEEQTNHRLKLEEDLTQMKTKVQSLQIDLDNSEAVQRDFVKLSQSLQIQLEKIRQAENEVRWQHEEDVEDCCNCKQPFSVTKRKHHCRHCGKIFCSDCLIKSVNSGPNLRPSRVCDVCHTILVQDATPYFSSEPPTTPD